MYSIGLVLVFTRGLLPGRGFGAATVVSIPCFGAAVLEGGRALANGDGQANDIVRLPAGPGRT